MRMIRALAALAASLSVPGAAGVATAQSMTPMRGEVRSVTDAFAVRVFPSNPYGHTIRVEIRVYDQDFAPVEAARVSASPLMLSANASRPVVVAVPFEGRPERKIRVCAESIPFPNAQSHVRAQICGKFIGRRAN